MYSVVYQSDTVNFSQQKTLNKQYVKGLNVVPPRIELGTHGFSVHCSTN